MYLSGLFFILTDFKTKVKKTKILHFSEEHKKQKIVIEEDIKFYFFTKSLNVFNQIRKKIVLYMIF